MSDSSQDKAPTDAAGETEVEVTAESLKLTLEGVITRLRESTSKSYRPTTDLTVETGVQAARKWRTLEDITMAQKSACSAIESILLCLQRDLKTARTTGLSEQSTERTSEPSCLTNQEVVKVREVADDCEFQLQEVTTMNVT